MGSMLKKKLPQNRKKAGVHVYNFLCLLVQKYKALGPILCVFARSAIHLTESCPFDPLNNPPSYLRKRVGEGTRGTIRFSD